MSSTPDAVATQDNRNWFGHPRGLYVCFATELWERFSFYGMKFLLLLYLTKYHLFTDAAGYDVLGAYAGLVYALPLIGGLLADRYLGMRKAVVFGALLLTAGHLTMAYEGAPGDPIALDVFFFAIALISVGVGFLKPNISTIVGRLYAQGDPRRDGGFTIFYMGINVGAFTATLLCGWLGETFGWGYGFGAAGIGMLLGLLTFVKGQPWLEGKAEPAYPERLKERVLGGLLNKEWAIYIGSLLSLGFVWLLVQNEPVVHLAQNSLLIVAVVGLILYAMMYRGEPGPDSGGKTVADPLAWVLAAATILPGLIWAFFGNDAWLGLMLLGLVVFIAYGFRRHNSAEYGRTVVLMVLILFTIVFWALFEQSAGSMTLYADRVLDRNLGDTEIRASMFGSLNPAFIMLLAIPFAALWVWLARRGLEPSTPAKFALGIIQAGLGFGALVLGAQFADDAGKVAMIWLVLAYLLHTMGELCLSPVGLSAVTKLSIGKVVGVSMGTWFLATALSETVATRLGKLAAIDTSEEGASGLAMLATYTDLYTFLMWVGIGCGVALLAISPWLRKGTHGIH
jgi:POT family proton-dependent oligopeptide transporter